ncbi:transposase domain-containing protein [Streptosporangium sp. NPDC000095]|uniref:transposase domain-containing protein n=1 Tax=Streptosporangium sp. NPDC000095 TaxID=3366184 RepID=UPI0036CB63A6
MFALGHLGELTALVPFEPVDAVLDETRTVQRRLRDLPSRVGSVSMRRLFEVVSGPLAGRRTPGARFGDRPGLEQEMWALLTLYQLLRTVMVDAAESRPGTDPDRCSFTIAFQTARDQVLQATGVITDGTDLVGAIGHATLTTLLPPRRPRVSTRKVTSPMSRYKERLPDGRPDRSRAVTSLDITLLDPPHTLPTASRDDRHTTSNKRRHHRVLTLIHEHPDRLWHPRDIALHLGDITLNTMYRQLSRWAERGLIRKIGHGIYTATTASPRPLPAGQKP